MHMLQLCCCRHRHHRCLFLCVKKVACLVSNCFFMHWICNTNSSCIQTTDPHSINMLTFFLIWFVVVLLLLQTMQHRHRCCFSIFFLEMKKIWHKMHTAFHTFCFARHTMVNVCGHFSPLFHGQLTKLEIAGRQQIEWAISLRSQNLDHGVVCIG